MLETNRGNIGDSADQQNDGSLELSEFNYVSSSEPPAKSLKKVEASSSTTKTATISEHGTDPTVNPYRAPTLLEDSHSLRDTITDLLHTTGTVSKVLLLTSFGATGVAVLFGFYSVLTEGVVAPSIATGFKDAQLCCRVSALFFIGSRIAESYLTQTDSAA